MLFRFSTLYSSYTHVTQNFTKLSTPLEVHIHTKPIHSLFSCRVSNLGVAGDKASNSYDVMDNTSTKISCASYMYDIINSTWMTTAILSPVVGSPQSSLWLITLSEKHEHQHFLIDSITLASPFWNR